MLSFTPALTSEKFNAKAGDEITVHFFQDPPRFRKLKITGIYETNLSEYFDSKVIMGDLRLIQRLNDWPDSVAGGLEVYVNDINKVEEVYQQIGETMPFNLYVEKVSDKFVQVFQWLELVSRQVNILLGIHIYLQICRVYVIQYFVCKTEITKRNKVAPVETCILLFADNFFNKLRQAL